jgi:hypothetical protein
MHTDQWQNDNRWILMPILSEAFLTLIIDLLA